MDWIAGMACGNTDYRCKAMKTLYTVFNRFLEFPVFERCTTNVKGEVAMRKIQRTMLTISLVLGIIHAGPVLADQYSDTIDLFKQSPVVQSFFNNCYGYAVFPTVGKGGFVVGGAYGTGQVYAKGRITGMAKMVEATFGLQAGGQAFSQILFFQDRRAYQEFTSGSFELEAGVSAVAITAGVQAQAGTEGATASANAGSTPTRQATTRYYKGMAVFVHATGGFMYQAVVGGQKFTFDPRLN